MRPRAEDSPGQAPFGPAVRREAEGHARAGRPRAPDRRAGRSPRPRRDADPSRQGCAGGRRTAGRVPRAAPGSPHPQGCRHGSRAGRGARSGRPARGGPDPGAALPEVGAGPARRPAGRAARSQPAHPRPPRPPGRRGGTPGTARGPRAPLRRDGRPGLPRRSAVGTAIRAGTRAQQIPRTPPLLLGAPVCAPAPQILRTPARRCPRAARSSPPRWPGDRVPDRAHPLRRARLPPAGRAALPAGEPRRMDWARVAGTARSRRPRARRPAPRPPWSACRPTPTCSSAALVCSPAALVCFPAALVCFPAALVCFPAALVCFPAGVGCFPAAALRLASLSGTGALPVPDPRPLPVSSLPLSACGAVGPAGISSRPPSAAPTGMSRSSVATGRSPISHGGTMSNPVRAGSGLLTAEA